jgi:hypothetical protein
MGSEVSIVSAKRNAVVSVRQRPVNFKSSVTYFDTCFKKLGEGTTLSDWLNSNPEWEVKNLVFDQINERWVLIGQRPTE